MSNVLSTKPGSKRAIAQLPLLTQRHLNRALIERQLLTRRRQQPVETVLEHLVGMQSQVPTDPFLGLWSRLENFDPAALDALMLDRRAVRIGLMRGTIHVVTARDALHLRPLTQPVYERTVLSNAQYRGNLEGLDFDLFMETGRRVFAAAPCVGKMARDAFAIVFPDQQPDALSRAVRLLLPLVQVTPRGTWQASHTPTYLLIDRWLDSSLAPNPSIDEYILRYLAAFGPATVADIQTWSRINALRPHLERLRPHLRTFRNECGRELFDVSDGPLPDPDLPVPVRFLPGFDNILLSHADRTRIIREDFRKAIGSSNGLFHRTYLVDGMVHGWWDLRKEKTSAVLAVTPFDAFTPGVRDNVADEAHRLLAFLAPDTGHTEVIFREP